MKEPIWPQRSTKMRETVMNFLKNKWFILTLRILVGAIFFYAGAIKLQEPLRFADSIATFRMVPDEFINILALGLPPFEIIVGLLLIPGWHSRSAAFCVVLLTVVFAIVLGQALARGLEVDCGCFGAGQPSPFKSWLALWRDLVLMAGAAWLYLTVADVNRFEKTT